MKFPLERINALQVKLNNHKLIAGGLIDNINDLQIFMEHHVFAVWDFMSLIKFLQNHFCPSTNCWVPRQHSKKENRCARLINEIILAEDGSKDNTKNILFELINNDKDKIYVNNIVEKKRGYGGAITSSVKIANGEFILYTDSDGQWNPKDFINFWNKKNSR